MTAGTDIHRLKCSLDIMDACLHAQSHQHLLQVLDRLACLVPFNAAILCKLDRRGELSERLNHSYPREWVREYMSRRLFACDPVVQTARSLSSAFSWASAIQRQPARRKTRRFLDLAGDFGLQAGASCTCTLHEGHGDKTLLSLETSGIEVNDTYLETMAFILPHVHAALERMETATARQNPSIRLTTRERETLQWAQAGKTAWEIGMILSISERTVRFHLKNIYRKLDVANRPQAIARAMQLGLI